MDGVFDGGSVEVAAEAVKDFELDPDGRRLGGAFAGADDFDGLKLLALLFENADDVGARAGAESEEQQLHGSGGGVGGAVGVHGNGVAGRANGDEFLCANPLDGGGLHEKLLEKREE